jgi:hypothetical protein
VELEGINKKIDDLYALLSLSVGVFANVDLGDIVRRIALLEESNREIVDDITTINTIGSIFKVEGEKLESVVTRRLFITSLNKVSTSKIVNIHACESASRLYGLKDLGFMVDDELIFKLRNVAPKLLRTSYTFPVLDESYTVVLNQITDQNVVTDGNGLVEFVVTKDASGSVIGYKFLFNGEVYISETINLLTKDASIINSLILQTVATEDFIQIYLYETKSIDGLTSLDGVFDLTDITYLYQENGNGFWFYGVEADGSMSPGELISATTCLMQASLIDITLKTEFNDNGIVHCSDVLYLQLVVSGTFERNFISILKNEYQREIQLMTDTLLESSPQVTSTIVNLQQTVNQLRENGAFLVNTNFSIPETDISNLEVTSLSTQGAGEIDDTLEKNDSWINCYIKGTPSGLELYTGESKFYDVTGNDGLETKTFQIECSLISNGVVSGNKPLRMLSEEVTLKPVWNYVNMTTEEIGDSTKFLCTIIGNPGPYVIDSEPGKYGIIVDDVGVGSLIIKIKLKISDGLPLTSTVEPGVGTIQITIGDVVTTFSLEWITETITEGGVIGLYAVGTVDITEILTGSTVGHVFYGDYESNDYVVIHYTTFPLAPILGLESGSWPNWFKDVTYDDPDGSTIAIRSTGTYDYGSMRNSTPAVTPIIVGTLCGVAGASIGVITGTNSRIHTLYAGSTPVGIKLIGSLCTVTYIRDPLGVGQVNSLDVDQIALNSYVAYLASEIDEIQDEITNLTARLTLIEEAVKGNTLDNIVNIMAGIIPIAGSGLFAKCLTVTVGLLQEGESIAHMVQNGVSFNDIFQSIASAIGVLSALYHYSSSTNLEAKGDIIGKTSKYKKDQVETFNYNVRIGEDVLTPTNYNTQEPTLHHEYVELNGLKDTGVYTALNTMTERVAGRTETPAEGAAVKLLAKMKLLPYHERTLITKFSEDEDGNKFKEILMTGIGDGNALQLTNDKAGYSGGQVKGNPGYLSFKYGLEGEEWNLLNYKETDNTALNVITAIGEGKAMVKAGVTTPEEAEDIFSESEIQLMYENAAKYYVDHVDSSKLNTKPGEQYAVFRTRKVNVNLITGQFEGLKAFLNEDSAKFGYKLFGHNCQNYCTSIQQLLLSGKAPDWMSEAGYQAYITELRNAVY